MKILLVGSHLGNNLESFVKRGLEACGCQVMFVGYQENRKISPWLRMIVTRSRPIRKIAAGSLMKRFFDQVASAAAAWQPDTILSIKGEMLDGEHIEFLGKEFGARTALWFPDDPRFFESLTRYIAPSYDYVFTKSDAMIPKYKEIGASRAHVLPFGCDPTVHHPDLGIDKKNDVCFVGTYDGRRARILKSIKDVPNAYVYGPYWNVFLRSLARPPVWGEEMTRTLNSSKIILNIHVESDLRLAPNMRTFEVPACQGFLLTDKVEGIDKYYKVGKEIVCYNDTKELVELVKYYLHMDEERKEVSSRGYERSIAEHTYEKRMNQLLSIIR
jgi:spore maturation protein CgeB